MADASLKVLLVVCCVIAIAIAIIASLLASVLFKREQYNKNPYYWCDSTWECCKNENGCDGNKSIDEIKSSGLDTYYPTDLVDEGSNYHQNCILPVKNAFNNFTTADTEEEFDLGFLYEGKAPTTSLIWGKGCTGPGGEGKCADPTYNPQVNPVCNYHSFDAPTANWPEAFLGPTGSLPGGTGQSYSLANNTSLNKQYWQGSGGGTGILDTAFGAEGGYQATNISYMTSWTPPQGPNQGTSSSNFQCPMNNPYTNQPKSTLCFNAYNVLRPDQFNGTCNTG